MEAPTTSPSSPHFHIYTTLLNQVHEAQKKVAKMIQLAEEVKSGTNTNIRIQDDETLMMGQRLCVPDVEELKKEILEEAHKSLYAMHPGSTKMYRTLKENYWWQGIKREIAEYVSRCLVRQQVKSEHQSPTGTLQSLPISEWKWEHITMDFVIGLLRTL